MNLSRYITTFMKFFRRFYYNQIGKQCLVLFSEESFKAIVITYLGLLLYEICHNFHLLLVERNLVCA